MFVVGFGEAGDSLRSLPEPAYLDAAALLGTARESNAAPTGAQSRGRRRVLHRHSFTQEL